MAAERNGKTARWCFTINNPGTYTPRWDITSMAYMVWQLERGINGTPHIQGYVRFKNAKNLQGAKNALNCTEAHMEAAQGTEEQCRNYCTKAETRIGNPVEHGTYDPTKGVKGKRTDLDSVAALCLRGATISEIATQAPSTFIKYPQGIAALREAVRPPVPRERDIFVHILWGATNTGKTHRVRMTIAPENLYVVSPGRDPWGRYEGQDAICFEEFDWSKWPIDQLKELLDKWPVQLDCRYTNKSARWTKVFILGNNDPQSWYFGASQRDRDALMRRIHRITEVTSQDQQVDLLPVIAPAAPPPVPTPMLDAPAPAGDGADIAPTQLVRHNATGFLQASIEISDNEESQSQ